MAHVTETSRVPFGRKPDKGKRLCDCSTKFLQWIVISLWDTDMHEWAFVAKGLIAKRESGDQTLQEEDNLDAQADAFLRNRGYGNLARKH